MDRGAWWATVHGANTSLSLPSGDPYLPDPSCLSTASGLASYLPLLLIVFHAAPLSELLSDHSKLKGFFFFSTFLLKSFNFLLFLWEDTQIYYHSLSQVANVIFVSLSENK